MARSFCCCCRKNATAAVAYRCVLCFLTLYAIALLVENMDEIVLFLNDPRSLSSSSDKNAKIFEPRTYSSANKRQQTFRKNVCQPNLPSIETNFSSSSSSSSPMHHNAQTYHRAVVIPKIQRIVVVTVWTHYPEMMKLHAASARTFLVDSNNNNNNNLHVEMVAVINSNDPSVRQQLWQMAIQLNMNIIDANTFPKIMSPSQSHSTALNTAMQVLLQQNQHDFLIPAFPLPDDILLLLDSDMFFMQPFPVPDRLLGHSGTSNNNNNNSGRLEAATMTLMSPLQSRHGSTYAWPNLSFFSFGSATRSDTADNTTTTTASNRTNNAAYRKPPQNQQQHNNNNSNKNNQNQRQIALYKELDFGSCFPDCRCDSGGCTKLFMERHDASELNVLDMARNSCNTDNNHYHYQESSNHTLQQQQQETVACQFWNQQISLVNLNGTGLPKNCVHPEVFALEVFHLRSAGSNWRGCDEAYLNDRRNDLAIQLKRVLPKHVLEEHCID